MSKKIVYGILIFIMTLSGCGTRDYGSPKIETESPPAPTENPAPKVQSRTHHPSKPGIMWRGLYWVGVPDERVEELKSKLRDDQQTDVFCAFGASVIGGAGLGLVIRAAGTWIFGGPVEVESTSPVWRRLEETAKITSQGILRGALTGAGCYLLLTGLSPLPFSGLLGNDFRGLSSSIILGGLAAVASAPYARKAVHKDWLGPETYLGQAVRRRAPTRKWLESLNKWSASSEIVNEMRYQVGPGLMIVGVGSGVGILVYQGCRSDESQ